MPELFDESLQQLPEEPEEEIKDLLEDEILETPEEELEPVVQKLRSGFGRIRVINKINMVVFQYDYKIKKTELTKIIEYLTTKYPEERLEVSE